VTYVLTCYKHGGLIGAMIFPDLETALKIKSSLESLGAEYKANLHGLTEADADQNTVDKVNDWLTANGFEAVTAESLTVK
jgi:hypothetical protein